VLGIAEFTQFGFYASMLALLWTAVAVSSSPEAHPTAHQPAVPAWLNRAGLRLSGSTHVGAG
jgi:hypothetical protein